MFICVSFGAFADDRIMSVKEIVDTAKRGAKENKSMNCVITNFELINFCYSSTLLNGKLINKEIASKQTKTLFHELTGLCIDSSTSGCHEAGAIYKKFLQGMVSYKKDKANKSIGQNQNVPTNCGSSINESTIEHSKPKVVIPGGEAIKKIKVKTEY